MGEPFLPTFVRSLRVSDLLENLMRSHDRQRFWADTTSELSRPRSAKANLCIRSQECSQLMVDLKGREFTALGGAEAGNAADRVLFYRSRWQPAISLLGSKTSPHGSESLGGAMDLFIHQLPDAKILQLSLEKTPYWTSYTISPTTRGVHRRNFQSLTPYSPSTEGVPRNRNSLESLEDKYLDRVKFEDPQTSSFDAVVVQEDTSLNIESFLKPGSFAISDNAAFQSSDLISVF